MAISVCVVGAGVVGLSTALQILQSNSHYRVTIVAEKFASKTTSDAAGAIMEPYGLESTPIELQKQWFTQTLEWIASLSKENPHLNGIQQLQIFFYFSEKRPDPYWKDWVPGFRKITAMERSLVAGNNINYGWCLSTFIIHTTKYMAWLMNRIEHLGGKFLQRKLTSLNELSAYDIIVNCSGVGANALVPDFSVAPGRGQVIRVKAPWIQHGYNYEDDGSLIYIFPRDGSVVLGGIKQIGNWNTDISKADSKKIFENCCKLMPSLKNAEIIEEIVGLRPMRPSIRIEIEKRNINGKDVKIVHNYGHGGGGYSLHWGCAIDAYKLVKKLAEECKITSKL